MKKNIWKRVVSLALILVLVIGMMPSTAGALTLTDYDSGYAVTVGNCSYTNKSSGQSWTLEAERIIIQELTENGSVATLEFIVYYKQPLADDTYHLYVTVTFDGGCTQDKISNTHVLDRTDSYWTEQHFEFTYTVTRKAGRHTGGNPICDETAICTTCGKSYSLGHNYEWMQDEERGWHWQECTYNSDHKTNEGACYGGTATCRFPAACVVCWYSYGETLPHSLN